MTYSTQEGSRHSGQPVELYKFVVDPSAFRDTDATPDTEDDLAYADDAAATAAGWGLTSNNCPNITAEDCAVTPNCLLRGMPTVEAGLTGMAFGISGCRSTVAFAPAVATRDFSGFTVGAQVWATFDYEATGHWFEPLEVTLESGSNVVDVLVNPPASDTTATGTAATGRVTVDATGVVTVTLTVNAGYDTIGHADTYVVRNLKLFVIEDADPTPPTPPAGSGEYHYTSADVSVTFNGDTYQPAIFTRTGFESGQSEGGDVDLTMPRDHEVALLFRDGLPVAPVTVDIYRLHRSDAASAAGADPDTSLYATAFRGRVTRARYRGATCVLTLSGGQAWLERKLPRVLIQPQCNWVLYGVGCGLNKESFRFQSTISAISGREVTITGLETESGADIDKFQNGFLLVPSGELAFIETQDGDVVTLLNPPVALALNDEVIVYQGCDRRPETCHARFNNLANFGGDAILPQKNPFGQAGFNV